MQEYDPGQYGEIPRRQDLPETFLQEQKREGDGSGSKFASQDVLFRGFGLYNIVLHPSITTFTEQIRYASWKRVWLLVGAFTVIRVSLYISQIRMDVSSSSMTIWYGLWALIAVPLSIFTYNALQSMLSNAFAGTGGFLEQIYTNLLFTVPLGIIGGVLPIFLAAAAPMTASWLSYLAEGLVGVYAIILNVFQVQAVHRLSVNKAVGVALLSVVILIGLVFVFLIPLFLLIVTPVEFRVN